MEAKQIYKSNMYSKDFINYDKNIREIQDDFVANIITKMSKSIERLCSISEEEEQYFNIGEQLLEDVSIKPTTPFEEEDDLLDILHSRSKATKYYEVSGITNIEGRSSEFKFYIAFSHINNFLLIKLNQKILMVNTYSSSIVENTFSDEATEAILYTLSSMITSFVNSKKNLVFLDDYRKNKN